MSDERQNQDDEINLIDIFAVLWHWKWIIISITFLAAIGVVIYSLVAIKLPPEKSYKPNVYTAKALMLIENRSSSNSGNLSSALGNIGSLASLAGVSLSSSASYGQLAIFLTETNSFLDAVVDEFGLLERYKKSRTPKTSSRRSIKRPLKAVYENRTGVLSISFTHRDPVYARDVANFCALYLGKRFDELGLDKSKIEQENLELNIANTFQEIQQLEDENRRLEQSVAAASFSGSYPAITADINRLSLELNAKRQIYSQLKVQYELLRISMASETPVFQVLEMAEVPERKSGPSRGKFCMIVTLGAGFFAVFLAFVLDAIIKIRNDPVAMAKLRRKK